MGLSCMKNYNRNGSGGWRGEIARGIIYTFKIFFDIFSVGDYALLLFDTVGGLYWIPKKGPTENSPRRRSPG
jgi:hypothetical protein